MARIVLSSGTADREATVSDVPSWQLAGDWFDVCNCSIPCPCTFAQAPTYGNCEGILAWHIREGRFGGTRLDDLNVVALGAFEGNIWAGEATVAMGIYIDERADEPQREALQVIFGGHGGGWPGEFARERSARYAGSNTCRSRSRSPTTWPTGRPKCRERRRRVPRR
jgi:hypothetical protein